MKIFVINLKRSSERRKLMAEQLDQLGLAYEFFDAIDGRTLSAQELHLKYNKVWARRHVGRDLSSGEIGCALSHIGVYRRMVREQYPCALVLEDDARLLHETPSVLNVMDNVISSKQPLICLLSECAGVNLERAVYLAENYTMAPIITAAYLTHAYVITLESAKRLEDILFPVVQVADDWSWHSRQTGITLFACTPPLATAGLFEYTESTIETAGVHRGENIQERFKTWRWWKQKIYRKFWMKVDQFGLGYKFWCK